MANLKASKKDILRTKRNRKRNLHFKTMLKNAVKTTLEKIENKDKESIKQVQSTCRLIDKVASKGILKKQTAARKKSRLVLAFNKAAISA